MEFCFYSGFNQMLQEKGLHATADWAERTGFSSVEFLQLPAEGWYAGVETLSDAKAVKKALQAHRLTTACYSVGINLLHGKTATDFLKKQAELASELGSPFFHHTLIDSLVLPPDAPSFESVFAQILDEASELALYCKKLGLTCLYEEQGLYFNGIKNFSKFFLEMKNRLPNVGVCGDFGNILFADEAPESFFKAFQKDILHVHLKDYQRLSQIENAENVGWLKTKGGAYLKDVPLGEGIVNVNACLQILKETDYLGVYSLELVEPIVNSLSAMRLVQTLLQTKN